MKNPRAIPRKIKVNQENHRKAPKLAPPLPSMPKTQGKSKEKKQEKTLNLKKPSMNRGAGAGKIDTDLALKIRNLIFPPDFFRIVWATNFQKFVRHKFFYLYFTGKPSTWIIDPLEERREEKAKEKPWATEKKEQCRKKDKEKNKAD